MVVGPDEDEHGTARLAFTPVRPGCIGLSRVCAGTSTSQEVEMTFSVQPFLG